MARLVPVDIDPFARPAAAAPTLRPVDYDPFAPVNDPDALPPEAAAFATDYAPSVLEKAGIQLEKVNPHVKPKPRYLEGDQLIDQGDATMLPSGQREELPHDPVSETMAGLVGATVAIPAGAAGWIGDVLRQKLTRGEVDWAGSTAALKQFWAESIPHAETFHGQTVEGLLAFPFTVYATVVADGAKKLTRDPQMQAAIEGAALVSAAGIPFMKRGTQAGVQAVKDSTWYREATIKERGLVPLTPEQLAANYDVMLKNGYSEAELAKMSLAFKQEAIRRRATGEQGVAAPETMQPASPPKPPISEPLPEKTASPEVQEAPKTEQPIPQAGGKPVALKPVDFDPFADTATKEMDAILSEGEQMRGQYQAEKKARQPENIAPAEAAPAPPAETVDYEPFYQSALKKLRQDKNAQLTKPEVDAYYFHGRPTATAETPQELTATLGVGGSGKGSLLEALDPEVRHQYVEVNSDHYKERMRLEPTNEAHEESSAYAKELLQKALDNDKHVIYDSQGTNFALLNGMVEKVLRKGGNVYLSMMYVDPVTARVRIGIRDELYKRDGKHVRPVPEEATIKGANRSLPTFIELFRRYRNNPNVAFTLRDNNTDGSSPRLVFTGSGGNFTIADQALFDSLMHTEYTRTEGGHYERTDPITSKHLAAAADEIRARTEKILSPKNNRSVSRGGRKSELPSVPEQQEVTPDASPRIEAPEPIGVNLNTFRRGDYVRDVYDGTVYEVINPDRNGMATIRDSSGSVKTLNAYNNPHYEAAERPAAEPEKPVIAEGEKQQPAPAEPEQIKGNPSMMIADWVQRKLSAGDAFTKKELWDVANEAYGGRKSEGKYTPKDAFDALELGINQFIAEQPRAAVTTDLATEAAYHVTRIRSAILEKIPSQSGLRTAETDEFQQFSTPPDLAYAMAWTAKLNRSDTVLEPSAGVGGLASWAKSADVDKVYVNELSPRRAALLKDQGYAAVFTENAEQLHNILPPEVKPTVVLMNPPFSATAGRVPGQRDSANVIKHLDQALQRLEPGGRLVALIGKWTRGDSRAVRDWFATIEKQYAFRAIIELSGKGYEKYGTTYDNRILVIDKVPASGDTVIKERYEDVLDALPALGRIRNERSDISADQEAQQPAAQPRSAQTPAGAGRKSRTDQPVRAAADSVESGADGLRTVLPVSAADDGGLPVRAAAGGGSAGGAGLPADGAAGGTQRRRSGRGGGRSPQAQPAGSGEPVDRTAARSDVDRPPADGLPGDAAGGLEPEPGITVEIAAGHPKAAAGELTDAIFETYRPAKVRIPGAKTHPGKLVQSAAMASVEPPTPAYIPTLSRKLIERGAFSDAQLEAIVYAGQAHQQTLPDGTRKGYFIGDGTGVGKGREISGIILDNFNQGRKKAVWVSERQALVMDAVRDWKDIGGDPEKLVPQAKTKAGMDIAATDGIIFTTYKLISTGSEANNTGSALAQKKGSKQSRLEQLIQWLGDDFDGVLVFDEAHNMQNAISMRGKRGSTKPSLQALAGMELQRRVPNARVVYVSATGATEVRNLAYADRLGLWGEGTAFANKRDFIDKIASGGLAAMEVVARDMKAMGVYDARSLSYDDVTYGRLEHVLTPEQRAIYDTLAEAWQIVLQNIHQALQVTNQGSNSKAKSAALAQFWGAHQRFFNQIITSMQMPSVLSDIQRNLDAGHAVVLQLVNTNEATQKRQHAKVKDEDGDLEDLDLTPREALMQYLEHAFPTQVYQEVMGPDGEVRFVPAQDSNGNPVQSAEAIAMRERLLDQLGSLKVPDGPLEYILGYFGSEQVAEVTGRTQRIVRVTDESGKTKTVVERRSAHVAGKEAAEFQQDKRRILVFSDAGSTGRSFHADNTVQNRRKRIHYLIQPGWRADKAVQGFGRTHRTNQAQAPHYVLVTTDLQGQRRFLSSIARRLNQLGAMTRGQRDAGAQGLFSEKDNLESVYANDAIEQFIRDLHNHAIAGLDLASTMRMMGLDGMIDRNGNLNSTKLPDVPQFLNRLLSLQIDVQNHVFNEFYERLEKNVELAIATGELDIGMENLKADAVSIVEEKPVYTQPETGAVTSYVQLEVKHKNKLVSFTDAANMVKFRGFYRNRKSGRIWAVRDYGSRTDEYGLVTGEVKLVGPEKGREQVMPDYRLEQDGWEPVALHDAEALWEKASADVPQYRSERVHLITGALLPIWDRLSAGRTRVVRVQTDDDRRLIGREIPNRVIDETLRRLGANRTKEAVSPDNAIRMILDDGATIMLANGWKVRRARVAGERRVELIASESLYPYAAELERAGLFRERVQYETRWFVPAGDEAPAVFERLTKHRPVTDVMMPERSRGGSSVVTLDFMGMSQLYDAAVRLLRSINPKAAAHVDVRQRPNDLGFVKSLLASPGRIEGPARYYVVHGKNAVLKQDRLRAIAHDKLKEIFTPIRRRELMEELTALAFEGDALGKEFSPAELQQMGVSEPVQQAYVKWRKFHNQVWRMLSAHRKAYGGGMGKREGHVPHLFENWNVYEVDAQGNNAGIAGTFRSLREAVSFANALNPAQQYRIQPKTFRLPDEVIQRTILKDASYFKLVEKVENAFTLNRDQAFDLVNDVARRKSRRRMFGPAMKRSGQSGFVRDDLHDILKHYYDSTARYLALDDFKARVVPKFEKDFGVELGRGDQALRDRNIARYVQEYINDLNGAPGMVEDLIDASMKRYLGAFVRTERPTIWTVNKLLHLTGVMKLGLFNLSAGVVNLSQLVNTFAKLPAEHFAWALQRAMHLTDADRAVLRRIGVPYDLGLGDTGGYSMAHKGGMAVRASMVFFQAAERANRVVASLAAYRYARMGLGYAERQARQYARRMVDETQFNYSVADTARIFRNPAGRLLGQFKPYAIKQIEAIMGLKGAEHIKFWVPVLLIAGVMGIPLVEGLAEFIEWLTGKDPLLEVKGALMKWAGADDARKRVAEIVMYGVGSQVGVDISKRTGTGDIIPKRPSDLLGPTIGTVLQAKKVLEKGADKTELVRSITPSVGNILTAIETALNNMDVADPLRRERMKYHATMSDVIAKGTGFRPLQEAKLADVEQVRQYYTRQYQDKTKQAVDGIIDALMQGDPDRLATSIAKAADNGVVIDSQMIERELINKVVPQDIRMIMQTPTMVRPQYLDIMDFAR